MHRVDQPILIALRQGVQHRAHFVLRMLLDWLKSLEAAPRHRQERLASIAIRTLTLNVALRLEGAQNAAEVTGVEAEFARDVACRRFLALNDLVQHARFRQRERAAAIAFLQHADVARVEPIEPAHGGDAARLLPVSDLISRRAGRAGMLQSQLIS